jgi:3-phenylpropionate/trans-cinnamate dioxygenase ferredoxin reductase component
MAGHPFVIVGASLTGAKAAEELREQGFDGRIILVGGESERPYERPPLSKEYLRGESPREKAYVHPEQFYDENDIELRAATTVTGLDASGRELELDGSERLRFERLLLATGAEPRRMALPGSDLEGILYLRELANADAIRERIEQGGKVLVVGAGWIGAEVGASARERGLEVTIIEQAAVPLERVLGPELGAVYRDLHLERGVELITGAGIEAFEGDGHVRRVRTTDGRTIDCDFVVAGIGVVPRTELAEHAGLEVQNGVVVNERLETSTPGIFAAGDVANARHPMYGRLRIEHWANALNQGPAAARNMLGRDEPYERIPYFFSDQYDVGMEYSGHASGADPVVFRGDPASREFIAFWLQGDRVAAALNMNVWDVTETLQALIRSGGPIDREQLVDESVPLDDLGTARPAPTKPSSARSFLSQGLSFTKRFVQARVTKAETAPVASLGAGEAKVLQLDGEKAAVYRDGEGVVHAVSAVCTHMGCLVEWESGDRVWGCPCHGSRFDPEGNVLQGPAKKPLKGVAASDEESRSKP